MKKEEDYEEKEKITLYLSSEIIALLEKRAKKNFMNLPEQIEDILRRSTINQGKKSNVYDAKVDDKLVGLFSRHRTGPKKKGKK